MPDADARPEVRPAPVAGLPALHQIVLPTPWAVGPVQVYLVEGDPLTLIDTGVKTPASRAALEAAFEALGHGLEDVRRVLLTHYHGDHLGQVQSIRETGAELEVWAHEAEAPMIEHFSDERDERIAETVELFREYGVDEELLERQTRFRRKLLATEPSLCEATRVDRTLRGGDRIPFKDFELEVIHTPGHTEGHQVLYEERTGTLVTGDHLMGSAVPFTDTYYVEGAPDPGDPLGRRPRFQGLPAYLASLRRLRAGSYRTILPAHGGILERPARVIEEALLFYEVRVQRTRRALEALAGERGEATAWEIWQRLFPKADPVREMRNRMLMVIGALDVLEAEGRCRTRRRPDGVLVHSPA
jgi:glyoxylase-like metal-dependent hydrolase (beta-lactamase superfamily II)